MPIKTNAFGKFCPLSTWIHSRRLALRMNDASLVWEPETSAALGFGFRCGFLGMLHMEIVQERLEREFNMTVITTVPSVQFIAHTTKGET